MTQNKKESESIPDELEIAQNNEENESSPDELKREFMKKFGKLAAAAPVGMFLLMGPGASKALASTIGPPPPPP